MADILATTPVPDDHLSLLSLDRRITAMEARQEIDREARIEFEKRIDAKLDGIADNVQAMDNREAERKGTIKGIWLVVSFFGSTGGTGLIFLIQHLTGWGG